MRELLLKIGYLFGLLFPYNRYVGILHLLQWIYTGYRSRNLLYFGKTSKLGFSQHICGEEYIVVRENVIIGKANSLTAFPVNNKQKIIIDELQNSNNILQVKISKNTNETLKQIQDIFSNFNVDIKHIKRPKKDEIESDSELLTIVGQYSKKGFKKNELLSSISSLENVTEIMEE